MQSLTFWQKLYVPEILRGMAVTTRHFVIERVGATPYGHATVP